MVPRPISRTEFQQAPPGTWEVVGEEGPVVWVVPAKEPPPQFPWEASPVSVGHDDGSAIARLARVVVPPYVRVKSGQVQRVEGYTYERRGGSSIERLQKAIGGGPSFKVEVPGDLPFAKKVDVEDQRPKGQPPLHVDPVVLEEVGKAVGIDPDKVKQVKLRFRPLSVLGSQGLTQSLGGGVYRVVVGVKPVKPGETYSERARYVVNNSLVHEMRHVAQFQGAKIEHLPDEQFGGANLQHAKAFGYVDGEVEAQAFGRLAWPGDPALKPLPKSLQAKFPGQRPGKALWAVSFEEPGGGA